MKKLILVLLVITGMVAACSDASTNREAAPTNTAANTAPAKTVAPLTEADATTKEKAIWDTLAKKDINAFSAMLADDMIYVAPEAVHDKAGTVKGVTPFVPSDVTFSDWKFIPAGKDAGVIVYSVKYKATVDGKPVPAEDLYCGSIWVNRNGKWLAVYHQESAVQKPPAPAPAKKPTPAPSAAPSAPSAPAVTTADAAANEKAVWDALKGKNYDTFASFLAPESIEVEPFGITDKAGSVKGVQGADLSKATLADWKTVNIASDAALVTYTVKLPGMKPDTERHSTVWVNKDGRWQAVFHQGTAAKAAPPAPPAKSASK